MVPTRVRGPEWARDTVLGSFTRGGGALKRHHGKAGLRTHLIKKAELPGGIYKRTLDSVRGLENCMLPNLYV